MAVGSSGAPISQRTPTDAQLHQCVESRDLDGLVALMDSSGRVPTLRRAEGIVKRLLADEPATVFAWGVALAQRPQWSARTCAAWFISPFWGERPVEVQRLMVDLAEDSNWSVREGASRGFARILDDHFDVVLPTFHEWVRAGSINLRRAVCLSVMPVVRDPRLGTSRAPRCLELLRPMMADRHPYVRKNLGPFAIGAAILNHHPELTFTTLERWRDESDDEWVRWNLAMAVSASGGRANLDRSLAFLGSLAGDRRPTVMKAVVSATRGLGKKTGIRCSR